MSIDLEAIEARLKAAAPGPWVYVDNGFDGYIMSASEDRIVGGEPAEGRIEPDDPNADFIAHSREDVPALLAEVKRLNSELQSENTQPKPDGKCREDDGCPTENAVLRREWRKLTEQLAITTNIPIDRLETICAAEKDGRCVVLPPVKGADIGNPLEPLKVYAALKSEVLKYDYRAEHEPQKISALDYTIIMALQDVLTRAKAEKALGKEQGHDE